MGQYSRWLHYTEVDRRLRAELEALEVELALLSDAIADDAQESEAAVNSEMPRESAQISTHNMLIRLLLSGLNELTPIKQAGNAPANGVQEQSERAKPDLAEGETSRQAQNGEIISAALKGRGQLPNIRPLEPVEGSRTMEQHPAAATPHPEIDLLPEDMQVFFDQHSQTDPQQEIPWWLRNIAANDQESLRTNVLVQRWIERRRQLSPQPPDEASPVKSEEGTEDE